MKYSEENLLYLWPKYMIFKHERVLSRIIQSFSKSASRQIPRKAGRHLSFLVWILYWTLLNWLFIWWCLICFPSLSESSSSNSTKGACLLAWEPSFVEYLLDRALLWRLFMVCCRDTRRDRRWLWYQRGLNTHQVKTQDSEKWSQLFWCFVRYQCFWPSLTSQHTEKIKTCLWCTWGLRGHYLDTPVNHTVNNWEALD